MRRISRLRVALPLTLLAVMATEAQGVVYVTDLPLFTALAPCASNAVSSAVMYMTRSACPQAVTDLQSCVCTKNNNFPSVSSEMSSGVSYYCGQTASQDQASAATVLSAYCNQASMPSFPTPSFAVSQYITDIPEFANLAGCAQSALSSGVQGMTYTQCPPEPTALASCACLKNQNSLLISQSINSNVRYYCSTHSADVISAQAMFAAYCNMAVSGTSAFPSPSLPPGDMTYYITALPQYSSLAPCAQSGISYAMSYQERSMCPSGVQAVASCACLKESMSGSISSSITSEVKWYCSSSATEDIASALNVFGFYCSAALNLVKASGVVESIAQTFATGGTGSVSRATGGNGGPANTGSANGGQSGSNGGGGDGSNATDKKNGPNVAVIAGAAAGGIAVLVAIGVAIFFIMRSKRRKQTAATTAANAIIMQDQKPPGYFGGDKAELAGNPIVGGAIPPTSPSPSTLKVNHASPRTDNVSPVSAHHSPFAPPPPLPGQAPPLPGKAELMGATAASAVAVSSIGGSSPPPMPSPYGQTPSPPPNSYPGQSPYGAPQQQHQYYNNQQPQAHEMQGGQTYSTMIRPELQGQSALPPPHAQSHEMQGTQTYSTMIRPELHGGSSSGGAAGAGYSPLASPYGPPGGPYHQHHPSAASGQYHEVAGNGGAAPPHVYEAHSRPVTAGSQHHLHPSAFAPPPQPPPQSHSQSGMSWQSGPVSGYSELDGGYSRGGPGTAR